MKLYLICLICLFFFFYGDAQSFKRKNVLVFTRNGKGYVHDNIPNAIHCFDSLSKVLGFKIIKSAEGSVFNDKDLKTIDLIVFASTNNDVFDDDLQRLAFRHYIEAGGRFFGLHSATGTERKWTWFKQLLGGLFSWHAKLQSFDVIKMESAHPALKSIPDRWARKDECYFLKELYPGSKAILSVDLYSLKADSADTKKMMLEKGTYDRYYPISWEHSFDGGHILITTLGHDKNDYKTSSFADYLKSNMIYMLAGKSKKDYSKAYAKDINELPDNLK